MNYWDECIEIAFLDAGIVATKEQIEIVAGAVEVSHQNYGMAHGYHDIPNHLEVENKRLQDELHREKSKRACQKCNGRGGFVEVDSGCGRSSYHPCHNCKGEGRI